MRRTVLPLLPVALALVAACGPSFTPFRFVEKSRVVGAVVSVAGDPTRTTPAPGETATYELLTADPGPRVGRTFTLVVCVPGSSNRDIVFCQDVSTFIALNGVSTLPAPGDPTPNPFVSFDVPDEVMLGDATELWVFGAVCNGGTVRDLLTDPPQQGQSWQPCMPDPAAVPQPVGQLITDRIPLERDANDRNHVPALAAITLDGVPFTYVPGPDDPLMGCAAGTAPQVAADGVKHDLVATATPESAELYVRDYEDAARPEEVYFRAYYTAGHTNNEYDLISADHPEATLHWTAPIAGSVDETGTLVRFYFQIADDRDAVAPFERAVCLVPAP